MNYTPKTLEYATNDRGDHFRVMQGDECIGWIENCQMCVDTVFIAWLKEPQAIVGYVPNVEKGVRVIWNCWQRLNNWGLSSLDRETE
jgi:hypothetical protein